MTATRTRTIRRLLVIGVVAVLAAGCGEADPGPMGLEAQVSAEQQRQDYVEGVSRALAQLGSPQGPQGQSFSRSVNNGNKRQLQAAAIAWRQGLEQLKALSPPKEAVDGHNALVNSVQGLDNWNQRIVNAAPNKNRTKALARQAGASQASMGFEAAVCKLVDAGFEVVDPGACTPLANAAGPSS